ncbi:PGAP1-like alpha/beta domain-containing protein [Mangrovitalea sediminis]|uniref:PGAP1-like alpha/beta domain-containing protein n=1 Tax=Mangrovitalea sediminis TaxID=1982043 RepID=UPI000BE54C30|nr:permease [Mangrovitalea sediminis]
MKPLPKRIKTTHIHPSDIQGLNRLVIDAITGLTGLVETVHYTVLRLQPPPETSTLSIAGGIKLIYRSIWQVTKVVGDILDTLIEQLVPLVDPDGSSFAREAVVAALNGVLGDYLEESGSPLAIPMTLRQQGRPLALQRTLLSEAFPQASNKVMVLAHGLCMNDLQWGRETSETPGVEGVVRYVRLAQALGYTPVFLHYNSGRHISTNGREFASLLETLTQEWPLPITELVIIAHSMGGLITRSACYYGAQADGHWLKPLKTIVFLGTPHHGSPLERGGNWVDMTLGATPYTAPFARLGKIRSAGITDLRYGYLLDEDWQGQDRFQRMADRRRTVPLPQGVRCYAVAATTAKEPGNIGERLLGDGLVPVNSALGRHKIAELQLPIPLPQQWIAYGTSHFGLLSQPAVYEKVEGWLAARNDRDLCRTSRRRSLFSN